MVNMLRKAENRILRLQREKQEKTTRWLAYQKQMKAAFIAEEKRYASAQTKYVEDMAEAEKQLQSARELMAQVASEFRSGPMEISEPAPAMEDAWGAMMRRTPYVEAATPTDPEMLEILRRYKRGEGLPPSSLPTFGGAGRDVKIPVGEGTSSMERHAPAPPVGPNPAMSVPATAAPSQSGQSYGCASPVTGHVRTSPYPETSPAGPKVPPVPPVHARTEWGGGRVGISFRSTKAKATYRARFSPSRQSPNQAEIQDCHDKTHQSSISDKLDSRRAQMKGTALDPFGIPKETGADASNSGSNPASKETDAGIIDDDQDELGTASPGLGRLDV